MNDCFDEIICFETLNPTSDEDQSIVDNSFVDKSCLYNEDSELPATPIVCKPFENAFAQAFKIAKINPQRTVRYIYRYIYTYHNILSSPIMHLYIIQTNWASFGFAALLWW